MARINDTSVIHVIGVTNVAKVIFVAVVSGLLCEFTPHPAAATGCWAAVHIRLSIGSEVTE